MKFVAVISEFNPLHKGHAHLLKQAKVLSGADAVLCIMSGNFVQRSAMAVVDMRTRAHMALVSGADAVIELPAVFATGCGEHFAQGALNILNAIPSVTHLVFGSECGDLTYLKAIASVQANESQEFKTLLKAFLAEGVSYATAYAKATQATLNLEAPHLPNDLLGIEYIKQLIKSNSPIQPLTIKRIGAAYHDDSDHGSASSASAIRALLSEGNRSSVKQAMPQGAYNALNAALGNKTQAKAKLHTAQQAFDLLTITALRQKDILQYADATSELSASIKKAAMRFCSMTDILSQVKSKCYTLSRIRRVCLQTLLNITHYPSLENLIVPTKLIGVSKALKSHILPRLPKHIWVRNNDLTAYLDSLSDGSKEVAQYIAHISNTAQSLYYLIHNQNGNPYLEDRLLEV